MKRFEYIDLIQKETTRIFGPAPGSFFRSVLKDHFFDGVSVRKGTIVDATFIGPHHNREIYENPEEFIPERWLNKKDENTSPYALIGFGGGKRTCIGKSLALL